MIRVVRRAWITLIAACGGAPIAPAPIAIAPPTPIVHHPGNDTIPVDPIAGLAEPGPDDPISWLVPGAARLEIGGNALDPVISAELAVRVIDTQGSQLRVAVALPAVRFSVWTDRGQLLAVIQHDERLSPLYGGGGQDFSNPDNPMEVVLHIGARVHKLAHRDKWTQVRYTGALEAEGWVRDDALGDKTIALDRHGRFPTGRQELMVVPGTVIRMEPRWAGRELAIMATDYFLDTIRMVDQSWAEVSYENSDLRVHGFASKHDPPGRLHSPRSSSSAPAAIATPTARAPSGTCLYTHERGDAVGYVVGDQDIELVATNADWWTLTIDTPWGPTAFAANGPSAADLVACAPAGSVPPPNQPTLVPPPTSP